MKDETKDTITNADFFKWYNDEITRYRNHEWQLASYSIGLSSAFLLFAKRADTAGGAISSSALALGLTIFVAAIACAAIHTHWRLNVYRRRRDILLSDGWHKSRTITAPLLMGWVDGFYFLGFTMFPVAVGIAAGLLIEPKWYVHLAVYIRQSLCR